MERARRPRIVSRMVRWSRLAIVFTILAIGVAVSACFANDSPPPAGVRPDGFPTGVFAKSYEDPQFGPIRLSWVFDADGNWAEVPEATAGQRILPDLGPLRGHYVVEGDLVSITVDLPIGFVHQHHWRLDGDRLITTFEGSDLPDDADFFAMLDEHPWVRVP
jgi:hypothetical protein